MQNVLSDLETIKHGFPKG